MPGEGASLFLSFVPSFLSPSFSFAAPPPFSRKSIEIDSNSEKPLLSHTHLAESGVSEREGAEGVSVCCGSLKPEEGI